MDHDRNFGDIHHGASEPPRRPGEELPPQPGHGLPHPERFILRSGLPEPPAGPGVNKTGLPAIHASHNHGPGDAVDGPDTTDQGPPSTGPGRPPIPPPVIDQPVEQVAKDEVVEYPSDRPAPTYPFVAGTTGVPWERILAEMGQATGVMGETREGSGELVRYEFDRDYPPLKGQAGPEYRIALEDEVGFGVTARVNLPTQAMSFGAYTRNEDKGIRSADLYAADFVACSLAAFEGWGAEVQHMDTTWSPESVNYETFTEVLDGDETNTLEAALATWSGKLAVQLGFTEVESINVSYDEESPDELEAVRVRFSKPEEPPMLDSSGIPDPPSTHEVVAGNGEPDATLPQAADAYIAYAEQHYLDEGETATIPTTQGPMIYTKGSADWFTATNVHQYNVGLFGDEYEHPTMDQTDPNIDLTLWRSVQRADQSLVAAGGLQAAMAAGRTVLDIASGEAVGLWQYARQFPGTTFIGLDEGYDEVRRVDPKRPGVQLTKGNWDDLRGIPDGSVDTILSYAGPFLWSPGNEFLDAITRVAAPGAILRFDTAEVMDTGPEEGDRLEEIIAVLERRGWEVTAPETYCTAVAIKKSTTR